jgi:hypothetical protein
MASGIISTILRGMGPGRGPGGFPGAGAGAGAPGIGGLGGAGFPFGSGMPPGYPSPYPYPFESPFPGTPGVTTGFLSGVPSLPGLPPVVNAVTAAGGVPALIQNASGGNASGGAGGNAIAIGGNGGIGGAGGAGGIGGAGGVNIAGGTVVTPPTVTTVPAASAGTNTVPGTTIQLPPQSMKNRQQHHRRNQPATAATTASSTMPVTATGQPVAQAQQEAAMQMWQQRTGQTGQHHQGAGAQQHKQLLQQHASAPTTAKGKYAIARFSRAIELGDTFDDYALERRAIHFQRRYNYPGSHVYERREPVLLADEFPFVHGYHFKPYEQVYIRIRLVCYGDDEIEQDPYIYHDFRVAVTDKHGSFVTLFEIDDRHAYSAAGLVQAHGKHSDLFARQRINL